VKAILPDYNNNIVNVSATLANYLGAPVGMPTIKILEDELSKGYTNVVFIVMDGMGKKILEKHLPEKSFLRRHIKQTVTSVFPSTTTNATTTILSATTPSQHGWFAWAMNFGERTVRLFRDNDYYSNETLEAGFVREKLPYKKFFEKTGNDIQCFTVVPKKLGHDISAGHHRTFETMEFMFEVLGSVCKTPKKKFVYSYFSDFDTMMHNYGTQGKQAHKMLVKFNKYVTKLKKECPNTLIVVTADHGQVDLTQNGHVEIYKDRAIMDCLSHNLSLDPRGAAFHVKSGMKGAFKKAFEKYTDDFYLFETDVLIEMGVFGKFSKAGYERLRPFLGDYMAGGKDTGKMLVFAAGKEYTSQGNIYKGHHTGMTEDEMFVPLIII